MLHASKLHPTKQVSLLCDKIGGLESLSLSQKGLCIYLVPESERQGLVEQVGGQALRYSRLKRLRKHVQGRHTAKHPLLPELLLQVFANEWQGALDHLLPTARLLGSKGNAHGEGFIGIC
jgi:hypothetical protein